MPFVPAKCPQCGGNVVVDNEKEAWVCDFCKTPFVVEKAINNFNTINNVTNNVTNNHDIKAEVVNVYENIQDDFVIHGGKLIKYNGSSTQVEVPHDTSLYIIGKHAFDSLAITSVKLPSNIKEIEVDAFQNCKYLSALEFQSNDIKLGSVDLSQECLNPIECAYKHESILAFFKDCSNTLQIKQNGVLKTLTEWADEIFLQKNKIFIMDGNTIPDGTRIVVSKEYVMDKTRFTIQTTKDDLSFPKSLEVISEGAFRGRGISRLCIPSNVKYIGRDAFRSCENLTELIIEEGVEYIDSNAFSGCKKIRTVQLPDSLRNFTCSIFPYELRGRIQVKISKNFFEHNLKEIALLINAYDNYFCSCGGFYAEKQVSPSDYQLSCAGCGKIFTHNGYKKFSAKDIYSIRTKGLIAFID